MGAGRGGVERENRRYGLAGRSHRRRDRRRSTRDLQSEFDRGVLQTAKASHLQSARLYALCVRYRIGIERFVLLFYRFEHRGVWPSRHPRKDGRGAFWRGGGPAAQRKTLPADQES